MKIYYLKGDATKPVKFPAYIVHVVNNMGGWGSGFVVAISNYLSKKPESYYRSWHLSHKNFYLGEIQIVPVNNNISVVNMLAQNNFMSKLNPHPLDLKALQLCLNKVYNNTKDTSITVHMPRIGCGLAGSTWDKIEPIINEYITVDTYVYDLV